MSIADEIRKLQELHQAGALTDDEFAQAKARVLAGQPSEPQEEVLRDQLAEMRRQQALDRLDRDWDRDREQYLMTSRYGHRYVPSRGNSAITSIALVGFGLLWTLMAVGFSGGLRGLNSFFPLMGLIFVIIGLGFSGFSFMRASQYEQAYRRYQRRRALLESGADDLERSLADESPTGQPASTAIQDLGAPTPCWKCGRAIPKGARECPHCGWMLG